jgi:peptidoglycan-associated lipoprotein
MKKKLLQGSIIPLILIITLAIGGCCHKKMAAEPAPAPMPTTMVEPAPVVQEPAPAPEPEVMMSLDPIYFDFDKSNLKPDAMATLKKDAESLKKNPDMKVRIEGNCDERGTSEYNMALGDRRAVSAMKYLGTLGIAADRMSTISYGKEKPMCPEHNEACWSKNRRDDITVPK